ncbi:hypothetical protein HPB48_026796 [Haemaphysalis longicornis]|uniref:Uncharacterized protein n=1 Tax=Haemaphysalis longicornis TaxID=44386 RepID=A0A9J6H216_HAELO|nr:hypothetical protein HPB48_026796 [Haemaphysalis longicornis]
MSGGCLLRNADLIARDLDLSLFGSSKKEPGKGRKIEIKNPHLQNMKVDILYHLALSTDTHQFKEMFGDVKFVCMGGTCQRMSRLAGFLKTGLGIELPAGAHLCDISKASGRYALYKVGPVIAISVSILESNQ